MALGSHKGSNVDLTDANWLRSKHADPDGEFAEVAFVGDVICLRKVSEPKEVLVFTRPEWDAFVLGAKDGDFSHL